MGGREALIGKVLPSVRVCLSCGGWGRFCGEGVLLFWGRVGYVIVITVKRLVESLI